MFQEVLEVGRGYAMDHLVGECEDLKLNTLADPQPVQLSENRGDVLKAWSEGNRASYRFILSWENTRLSIC